MMVFVSAAICGQFGMLLQEPFVLLQRTIDNIKCAQYATLTYVEDESRSIVYYETDAMSDSRSIIFEYLFSNAQKSASGLLRCGGVDTNEISWTSYDEKRDAELEKESGRSFI